MPLRLYAVPLALMLVLLAMLLLAPPRSTSPLPPNGRRSPEVRVLPSRLLPPELVVGHREVLAFRVENPGPGTPEEITVTLDGLGALLELTLVDPPATERLCGASRVLRWPGMPPGEVVTYTLTFTARQVGHVDFEVVLAADGSPCYTVTTHINLVPEA